MQQSTRADLAFLLDHLRWSLEQPRFLGQRQSAHRVWRALERVVEAFDRHSAFLEACDGPFGGLADPALLPLIPEVQSIARLRSSRRRLRTQLHCLATQFRDALALFPPCLQPALSSAEEEGLQEVQAFRLFGVLEACVRDVVDALQKHGLMEDALLEAHGVPERYTLSGCTE